MNRMVVAKRTLAITGAPLKEVDSFWGELGWALLEMMNAGLAEWTLGPALRSLTAKIQ
jgi:hypothetical protein